MDAVAMHARNKPSQTAKERSHADRVAQLPCAVCDVHHDIEVHEPEQGLWFIAIPLCYECHRGTHGWHGDRLRWTLHKMSELKAINQTQRQLEW
jgi:hypothetical protein